MIAPRAVATLSEDRKTFTLTVGEGLGAWSGTYTVDRLDGWIRFYRGLIQRRPASAVFYNPSIRALERVRSQLQGFVP